MNLCSTNHEEVCFEDRKCPACEVRRELESDINDRDNTIVRLENQVGDLESKIEDLELEIKEAGENE